MMNVPRCTHMTIIQNDKIYVMGGYTGDCERSTIIEYLNKAGKQWQNLRGELPYGVESALAVQVKSMK